MTPAASSLVGGSCFRETQPQLSLVLGLGKAFLFSGIPSLSVNWGEWNVIGRVVVRIKDKCARI
jgi:hypothetical protein